MGPSGVRAPRSDPGRVVASTGGGDSRGRQAAPSQEADARLFVPKQLPYKADPAPAWGSEGGAPEPWRGLEPARPYRACSARSGPVSGSPCFPAARTGQIRTQLCALKARGT